MNALTTTICTIGTSLILGMWGMKQIDKINPMSLFYLGANALGFVLLFIAMLMTDADMMAFDNWPMQIILLFISTWACSLLFRKK